MAKQKLYTTKGLFKTHVQMVYLWQLYASCFEHVVHQESEIWTSLPHSLPREAYYSISRDVSTRNRWHDKVMQMRLSGSTAHLHSPIAAMVDS